MTEQATITAYNIPSGMGGVFEVSIAEDMGEQVKVRIWYGRPTPKGWKSWGEWDGSTRVVSKSALTKEHTKLLVRPIEQDDGAFLFITPYEDENYTSEKVFRKYVAVYPDSDFMYMSEVSDNGMTIKRYPADRDTLTDEQIQSAYKQQHDAFPSVLIWERHPGQRYI